MVLVPGAGKPIPRVAMYRPVCCAQHNMAAALSQPSRSTLSYASGVEAVRRLSYAEAHVILQPNRSGCAPPRKMLALCRAPSTARNCCETRRLPDPRQRPLRRFSVEAVERNLANDIRDILRA